MRIIGALCLCCLCAIGAHAGTADTARQLFYRGNAAYGEGNYAGAIAAYEEILSGGNESGEIYYNLANAYFKNGQLGKAVLNYERARRFLPRDADVRSNLAYAVSFLRRTAPVPRGVFRNAYDALAGQLTADEAAYVAYAIYLLGMLYLIMFLFVPSSRRAGRAVGGGLLVLCIVSSAIMGRKAVQARQTYAVVIAKEAACRFEPVEAATTFFTLTEGDTVRVLTYKGLWSKVQRTDGKQGWLQKEVLEKI